MSVKFTVRRRLTQAVVGIAALVATLITTAGTARADSGHELWLGWSDNVCAVDRAEDLSGTVWADACTLHGNNPPQAQWYLDAAPRPGFEVYTRIQNGGGGGCLTADIGSSGSVHVTGCRSNDPNQQWSVYVDELDLWEMSITIQGLRLGIQTQPWGAILAVAPSSSPIYWWSFDSPSGPWG